SVSTAMISAAAPLRVARAARATVPTPAASTGNFLESPPQRSTNPLRRAFGRLAKGRSVGAPPAPDDADAPTATPGDTPPAARGPHRSPRPAVTRSHGGEESA